LRAAFIVVNASWRSIQYWRFRSGGG